VLANVVRHDPSPDAIDVYWEGYKKANPIARFGANLLGAVVHAGDPPEFKDSELAKAPSADSDEAVRGQFLTRLDEIRKAISLTEHHLLDGDLEYLLGLGSLRQIVQGELAKAAPGNEQLAQRLAELLKQYEIKQLVETVGTVAIQVAGLFVPGGQFISAAIGMGQAVASFDAAAEQWSVSRATVDPSQALVDQQEAEKRAMLETINLAMSAVALVVEFKAVTAEGHLPQVPEGTPDAPKPTTPGGTPTTAAPDAAKPPGVLDDFQRGLKKLTGTLGPTVLDDASKTAKMAKDAEGLVARWTSLTSAADRAEQLALPIVNERFAEAGLTKASITTTGGYVCFFNREKWMITLGTGYLDGDLNPAKLDALVNMLGHEARHGEQDWFAARYWFTENPGKSLTELSTDLHGMDPGALQRVMQLGPLDKAGADYGLGKEMFDTVHSAAGWARTQQVYRDVRPLLEAQSAVDGAANALQRARAVVPADPNLVAQAETELRNAQAAQASAVSSAGGPAAADKVIKDYHGLANEVDAYKVGPDISARVRQSLVQSLGAKVSTDQGELNLALSRLEELMTPGAGWSADQLHTFQRQWAEDVDSAAQALSTSQARLTSAAKPDEIAALGLVGTPKERLARAVSWADQRVAEANRGLEQATTAYAGHGPDVAGQLPRFKLPGEKATEAQVKALFDANDELTRALHVQQTLTQARAAVP